MEKKIIYSANVSKTFVLLYWVFCIAILIVIAAFAADYAIECLANRHAAEAADCIANHSLWGKSLAGIVLLLVALGALFVSLDYFLLNAFGKETISVDGNMLIVETRRHLIRKARTIALGDVDGVEIDTQTDKLTFSSVRSMRYMRQRGNIIIHHADGTRQRVCMSSDPKALKSVAEEIQTHIHQ